MKDRFAIRRLFGLVMMFSLLVAQGCVSVEPQKEATFTNTVWSLKQLGVDPIPDAGSTTEPHLIFLDDGRVSGYGGCNRFSGRYGTVDDSFRFLEMAATKRACAGDSIEPSFLAAMKATMALRFEDGNLSLLDDQGRPLAVFRAFES